MPNYLLIGTGKNQIRGGSRDRTHLGWIPITIASIPAGNVLGREGSRLGPGLEFPDGRSFVYILASADDPSADQIDSAWKKRTLFDSAVAHVESPSGKLFILTLYDVGIDRGQRDRPFQDPYFGPRYYRMEGQTMVEFPLSYSVTKSHTAGLWQVQPRTK